MEFGVWDHIDRSNLGAGEQFEARLQLAEAYDAAGFYAYHVAEHHGTPFGLAPSPGIFFAALAQRTRRLRFGPLVYLLPLYHPLRLYDEICMLDQMSGGRFELGVGRGISPHELGTFGIDPDEAQSRFREALALILQACVSTTLNFEGKFYSARDVPLQLKPVQLPHPPLWYGAVKPDTADWAARHDINIVCGNGPTAEIRAVTDRYRAVWQELGHSLGALPKLGMTRQLVLAETDEEAGRVARRAFRLYRSSFVSLWKRRGDPLAAVLMPDDYAAVEQHGEALAGSADTVRRALLRQVSEAGVNYLVCRFAFGDLSLEESQRSVRLFIDKVMPALRAAEPHDAKVA
jgi:alkanesulfonate monooxygenase SsuD/methylene tetrahydromethanopterin reductase-like flavin-dependent oxidoreductase (luciferase family)